MNYIYAVILNNELVDVWRIKTEAVEFANIENKILRAKHCTVKRIKINI